MNRRALVAYATRAGSTSEVAQAVAERLRDLVTPRDEAFFAGKVDPATLSCFERWAVKMVKSPVGDKRDWRSIRAWADGLGARLR